MGGQNHQPCNRPQTSYLRLSTKMSRDLSVARAYLEQANIALEDVLLQELAGRTGGSVKDIVEQLSASDAALEEMTKTIGLLRADMHSHAFEDLPTLQSVDLDALGTELASSGLVQSGAWTVVSGIMRSRGFSGMLDFFDREISSLRKKTDELILAVRAVENTAKVGQLNLVLEQNQSANFKIQFAVLYSSWHQFLQVFLASSMLSTDLWYRYCGVGSLLEQEHGVQVA
jgi:hypothetical protein